MNNTLELTKRQSRKIVAHFREELLELGERIEAIRSVLEEVEDGEIDYSTIQDELQNSANADKLQGLIEDLGFGSLLSGVSAKKKGKPGPKPKTAESSYQEAEVVDSAPLVPEKKEKERAPKLSIDAEQKEGIKQMLIDRVTSYGEVEVTPLAKDIQDHYEFDRRQFNAVRRNVADYLKEMTDEGKLTQTPRPDGRKGYYYSIAN